MKRIFCVQPYAVKRHKLAPSGATVFEDVDDAIRTGHRLAKFRAGIVVLSQDIDAGSGRLSKPEVIAIHGRVPASWHELSALSKAA